MRSSTAASAAGGTAAAAAAVAAQSDPHEPGSAADSQEVGNAVHREHVNLEVGAAQQSGEWLGGWLTARRGEAQA
jgi:hypothetical protein